MLHRIFLICLASIFVSAYVSCESNDDVTPAAYSLTGTPLFAPSPSEKLLAQYEQHKQEFEADPDDADKLIWHGRFTAYKGDYMGAIEIFTNGTERFPGDARMLRHRGHRYISIRKFDEAIADFEQAVVLIEGRENEIEPDGMPNAKNIPVSTLHGNIWYHLGLAYYLKHDFDNARRAYQNCLATSEYPDNVVSATHWLYMINRRMGKVQAADKCLDRIDEDMKIIENVDYYNCCLFYKHILSLDELEKKDAGEAQSRDAVDYAIGNWQFYNGNPEKALARFEELTANGMWNSFGYLAAEADLASAFTIQTRNTNGDSDGLKRGQ